MGDRVQTDRYSVQNEMIPLIVTQVYNYQKDNMVQEAIEYLDDLKISNEMVKEHLLSLSLNKGLAAMFDKLDTKQKAAFTREYNKTHKAIVQVKGNKSKVEVEEAKDSDSESD